MRSAASHLLDAARCWHRCRRLRGGQLPIQVEQEEPRLQRQQALQCCEEACSCLSEAGGGWPGSGAKRRGRARQRPGSYRCREGAQISHLRKGADISSPGTKPSTSPSDMGNARRPRRPHDRHSLSRCDQQHRKRRCEEGDRLQGVGRDGMRYGYVLHRRHYSAEAQDRRAAAHSFDTFW